MAILIQQFNLECLKARKPTDRLKIIYGARDYWTQSLLTLLSWIGYQPGHAVPCSLNNIASQESENKHLFQALTDGASYITPDGL